MTLELEGTRGLGRVQQSESSVCATVQSVGVGVWLALLPSPECAVRAPGVLAPT